MTSTITAIDARPETRIALDRLSPDPLNVRKTYRPEAIAELAASIKAVGLLKNLVVRKAKKRGHFYVSAGGRRLAALNMLAEAGDLTADYAVRAIECSAAEAVEISLAENVTAEAMNPVDEFEAYNALVSDRVPVAEIAARFGKTDAYICSGAQSNCGGGAIEGVFRRTIGETGDGLRRTFRETGRTIGETDARSSEPTHAA